MIAAITGASGYVGLNLAQVLLDAGHQVRAIDRVRSPSLDPRVSFIEADILNPASIQAALEGVDVVYHLVAKITLAQEDPVAWTINVDGVRIVAEAALACKVKRMVHVSSIASFDQNKCNRQLSETLPRSTDAALPVYSRSKYAGEQEFLKVVAKGLDGVICYPTGVYGPTDFGSVISRLNVVFLDSARGKIPAMVAGGFDLVDVRDVAMGLLLASERGRTGENYLLGGHYIEMLDACRVAARYVGRPGPKFSIPMGFIQAIAPMVSKLSKNGGAEDGPFSKAALDAIATSPIVDRSKAERDLGYAPRPLEETMGDLIAFFVAKGHFKVDRAA
ncbi:NAD-dependent epimerase/dehydratase family protein [Stenotrophobium rhamnosiphilum]|uniref:Epimerase n=1 Tax=Stenotrophobium rhamnosiphilum TaxID=2029166 RepID=A0A2T5MD76_9GAMM|nr:NAD-dependent epimerase/dehydratase family protein [Stenotrophobium rhamnosiphilum]PTU30507.1 epimerase [Stenotrophobium rhamnosiphilum]